MTRKQIKQRAQFAKEQGESRQLPGVVLASQAILDCVDYHELSVSFLIRMPEYATVCRVWCR